MDGVRDERESLRFAIAALMAEMLAATGNGETDDLARLPELARKAERRAVLGGAWWAAADWARVFTAAMSVYPSIVLAADTANAVLAGCTGSEGTSN